MTVFFITVPPQIIDDKSSDDIVVQEGDNVVLQCSVTGVPQPEVTWFYCGNDRKESTCKLGVWGSNGYIIKMNICLHQSSKNPSK